MGDNGAKPRAWSPPRPRARRSSNHQSSSEQKVQSLIRDQARLADEAAETARRARGTLERAPEHIETEFEVLQEQPDPTVSPRLAHTLRRGAASSTPDLALGSSPALLSDSAEPPSDERIDVATIAMPRITRPYELDHAADVPRERSTRAAEAPGLSYGAARESDQLVSRGACAQRGIS